MNPITIGAGIGAVGSAITGKNPLQGALIGGATGGLFGGKESLFGDKLGGLFSSTGNVAPGIQAAPFGSELAKQSIPSMGIQNIGQNITQPPLENLYGSWNIGQSALPATTTTGAYAGGIPLSAGDLATGGNANISKLFNYTPPTAMDKITGLGTDVKNWVTENPMPALSTGMQFANAQQPQPRQEPAIPPITRGSYNVAPNLGMGPTQTNNVSSKIQFTPEQLKLYYSQFKGGY